MRKVKNYTEEERKEILSGQKKSEMKVGAYCRKHRIPASTFHTWRRNYQEAAGSTKKGFIKVKSLGSLRAVAPIRIKTPEGYHLEIPVGADSGWIQGIIEAVKVR